MRDAAEARDAWSASSASPLPERVIASEWLCHAPARERGPSAEPTSQRTARRSEAEDGHLVERCLLALVVDATHLAALPIDDAGDDTLGHAGGAVMSAGEILLVVRQRESALSVFHSGERRLVSAIEDVVQPRSTCAFILDAGGALGRLLQRAASGISVADRLAEQRTGNIFGVIADAENYIEARLLHDHGIGEIARIYTSLQDRKRRSLEPA